MSDERGVVDEEEFDVRRGAEGGEDGGGVLGEERRQGKR